MKMLAVFVILMHVSQHASGVEVYEGADSALLPCLVPGLPGRIKVLWSRLDLNPTTIHQHQAKEEVYVQNQLYSRRTSMSADSWFTGEFGLTLSKPRLSDSGNYTCIVYKGGREYERIEVQLQVKELYTFPAEASVLLCVGIVLVLLLVCAVGAAVYLWYNYIPVSQVKVKHWEESVKLPYKTKVKLPDDAKVEWSRCGPKPMTVHVYPKVSRPLLRQDTIYDGRTNVEENPVKTGDLSLTLKHPCYSDSGNYICTVQSDGNILAQKVVRLHVRGVEEEMVEVEEWVKSFTLPFISKDQLPEDATVEWRRSEPVAMTVHVYENRKVQPETQEEHYRGRTQMNNDPLRSKELSLTILNSGYSDRGTFICTVQSDGKILAQKVVRLHVRGVEEEMVEVEEWEESFTLPFRTEAQLPEDATVEWRRSGTKDMAVHVYENHKDKPETQHESYLGRTQMKDDPLRSKDLSVTILNSGYSDSGTYICTVQRDGKILAKKVVRLQVKGVQEVVEVREWKECLELPFRTEAQLPADATVEWRRPEPEDMTIHVNEKGKDRPEKQHGHYRGRTKMNDDPLRSKDLSVTISYNGYSDRGTYICTVKRDGNILIWKEVLVHVKGVQEKVDVGEKEESFTLPFRTQAQLPEDATVMWRRSEPKTMTVHVYQNKEDKPGKQDEHYRGRTKITIDPLRSKDLSVTISYPGYSDRGTYICTVRKGGNVLVWKEVLVHIKGVQEKVKVGEKEESFTLPFRTQAQLPRDATVMWRRFDPKATTVHVYENNEDKPEKQREHYHGRTQMNSDPLRSKDLSLTIYYYGYRHRGIYICTVHKDGIVLARKEVLVHINVEQDKELVVGEWEESFTLPFISKDQLPEDATVEWRRSEPVAMIVHVYENRKVQPDKQDEHYRGRTQMNDDPLRSKELSVTISYPGYSDRGTYICTVRKGGNMLARKEIWLRIKANYEI